MIVLLAGSLGIPADPAFLLNGWAVVVFLLLLLAIGVPVVTIKVVLPALLDAEKRRGDTLEKALDRDKAAELEKDAAILELLQLARSAAGILEKLQDARDAAYAARARERVDATEQPGGGS